MFQIFSKNSYLVDQLEGLVDIHNHILPGIDDGAKTVEDSVQLLRGFKSFGINEFVCTPHIHSDLYPNTPHTIQSTEALLKAELLKHQDLAGIHLESAAEHLIDSDYEQRLDQNQFMPLRRFYVLVEVSFLQPSLNFDTAITKTQNLGYHPILAHPERYSFLHGGLSGYQRIKSKNIYLQLNLLSIAGHYGATIQKESFRLLKEGLADFVGSDVHNINHLESLKKAKLKGKNLQLFKKAVENTKRMFEN